MLDYVKKFMAEAKGKLSTYLGLLIASAGEIRSNWAEVVDNLPKWHWLHILANHVFLVLGLLAIWARIRRDLKEP